MTSTSSQGDTSITLQFALDRDIDAAAQDVQSAISKTLRTLPQDMLPPSYQKVDPSAEPDPVLRACGPRRSRCPSSTSTPRTRWRSGSRSIDGVAQVQVFGSQKYAVRIQLDPQALAARSIGMDEVSTAVDNGNVNLPTGHPLGHRQGVLRSSRTASSTTPPSSAR